MKKISILSIIAILPLGASVFLFNSQDSSALVVGEMKMIDDPFHYDGMDSRNASNCEKISPFCNEKAVSTPGECGLENVKREFYCAGPWRSSTDNGANNAYLYLSRYRDFQGHPQVERLGWAMWQWRVETSGWYRIETMYRSSQNRGKADYVVLKLTDLGEMDNHQVLHTHVENQERPEGAGGTSRVQLGDRFWYNRGEIAAVGLWGHEDGDSDSADSVIWTYLGK